MSRKKVIWMKVMMAVIAITASLLILSLTYQAGRDKGRSETVELIDQLANEYVFTRIQDEDSWNIAYSKGDHFFQNYDGSKFSHEYDSDEGKIHLSYEK